MSTTEPTAIDEKKAEDEGNTTDKADWKGFFKNFSNSVVMGVFVGVVCIGSMGLFLAKVSNANILPTKIEIEPTVKIEPYPSIDNDLVFKRNVPIELIFMNPVKILSLYGLAFWENVKGENKYYIQEANFVNKEAKLDFMDDFKESWLCDLKNKANPPKTTDQDKELKKIGEKVKQGGGLDEDDFKFLKKLPVKSPFWTYEFNTMASLTCNAFKVLSNVFFYMNYLPEWATMLVFALFFSVIITCIIVYNYGYSLIYHLSNFYELIKNLYKPREFNSDIISNSPELSKPDWYDKIIFFPMYIFVYIIGCFWSFMISPIVVTFYTFYKALSANYIVREKPVPSDPEKVEKMNLWSFIKNTLYYKKTFIIILVMINLMGVTNTYLGTSYLSGVIIAFLILIFGLKVLEIDPEPIKNVLYAVINTKFPPISQPEIIKPDLDTAKPDINVCKKDKSKTPIIPEIELSSIVTGKPKNVIGKNTTSQMGGGKHVKNMPKIKTYNLKIV